MNNSILAGDKLLWPKFVTEWQAELRMSIVQTSRLFVKPNVQHVKSANDMNEVNDPASLERVDELNE